LCLFKESQTKGGKHQNDADVRYEPLPKSVPKEQQVNANDNRYQSYDTNCEQ